MIARAAAALSGALLVYVAAFLAYALLPRSGHADMAVVLGSQVLNDGTPSARLTARLNRAVQVFDSGLVKLILVSGGQGASGFSEAAVMRAYLLRAGLPASALLEDDDGRNTRATARHVAHLLDERHLQSVLVVTQYFHVPRCLLALRQAGVHTVSATYPAFAESRDAYAVLRELAAFPAYALSGGSGAA